MAVIEADGLVKRYGPLTAVDHISLQVQPGEIFGIVGANGAGKTTTVECLQGLRRADAGHVRVLGLDPARDQQELRRRIGSQLQEAALPDRMKVWEALDLFASIRADGPDWRDLLNTWGLAHRARTAFAALSGGERQRLFVALALVNDPEVVFLDELTQGLDPTARRTTWGLIGEMRERGVTVVLVTHYMDEVEELCDRVAVINKGRVVATGTPGELIRRLQAAVTVRFTCAEDVAWLRDIEPVQQVDQRGASVVVTGSGTLVPMVSWALVERGIVPTDLRVDQPSFEDVYLSLTGESALDTQGPR